ncbi:hypothetical protein OJAV_G00177230 [Oryzias javanicus]|uniref:Epidermal growth factor receptor substrate 15-like 1 n=1 Tax=Oryzias javanicus TaxID=123683 RepID=A0A3S2P1P6_ORYJA|nr:hypothetical protein OJAV_G00177230 [Oryzias javanicus]
MAELLTVSQLSNGNSAYELYYRQLDPGNTGKISAAEAAQFLKKSGLPDSTLGKIWDLADSDRKGFLDKKGFFIALRLVASAQAGSDVSLSNLSHGAAVPKFRDASSPLTRSSAAAAADSQWAIRPDEKGKFEGIFESLAPVQGLLSGDKVRPVLINSKLPLGVLGKIWDLSDVDKDGHLDKEEFTVALHLVYRAMEKEPVPSSLPANLVPPSKRKKSALALPGAVAVLPSLSGLLSSPVTLKETPQSSSPAPAVSLSPKPSFKSSSEPEVKWAVPAADRARYEDLFQKTDTDDDGLVTGGDVIEIFMQSTLSQTMLAQIWGLADTKHTGKLTREQFCLAMHLIHQKSSKGIDPPSTLTPDMIPPSERTESSMDLNFWGSLSSVRPGFTSASQMLIDSFSGSLELTGVKDLDDLSKEIAQLERERFILEHQIQESEESLVQKNGDVQSMQRDAEQESGFLQELEAQQRDAQGRLQDMELQRSKLDGMLHDVKHKCQEEGQLIASMQSKIRSQEAELHSQEDELNRTKSDLGRLQEEEAQLEQRLLSGRLQLETIMKSLKTTQEEISQARTKLVLIQENQKEITRTIEEYNGALSNISSGNAGSPPDLGKSSKDNECFRPPVHQDSLKDRIAMFNSGAPKEPAADPFQTEDPFRSNLLKDPFGDDPFKESDPFRGTSSEDFFKTDRSDLFGSADPFAKKPVPPLKPSAFSSSEPFSSGGAKSRDSDAFGKVDPFRTKSFAGSGAGFADFSHMSKQKPDSPGLTSKKSLPSRPAPPYVGLLGSSPAAPLPSVCPAALGQRSLAAASRGGGVGSFGSESQQLEWARQDGEREEQERLRRLRLQELQDLELAIALSKADALNA